MGSHSQLMNEKGIYFNLVRQQEKKEKDEANQRSQG